MIKWHILNETSIIHQHERMTSDYYDWCGVVNVLVEISGVGSHRKTGRQLSIGCGSDSFWYDVMADKDSLYATPCRDKAGTS